MLNSVNKIFEGTKQSRIGKVAVADYVICGAYSWHFRVPSKNENKKKLLGKCVSLTKILCLNKILS